MAWSTAELAELAGTSLRAVRHYHAVGLLAEPERGANGWKHYGLEHLARLREVVRLRELGFSIAEIHDLSNGASLTAALARLDDDLRRSMTRLQRLRDEVAALTATASPASALPSGVSTDGLEQLSESDRSFLVLVSRLLDPPALDEFVALLRAVYAEPALVAFDTLPADADEATRAALARDMLEPVLRVRASHATYEELAARGAADPGRAVELMREAVEEQNNPAQADVAARLEALVADRTASVDAAGS